MPHDAPIYLDTHDHTHRDAPVSKSRGRLWIVLILTFIYMLAEIAGGLWTGSLALLADAGHMLTDVAALALALAAMWFAIRPATPQKTYGYYRLEILAALVNGVALVVISFFIFYEAVGRWATPPVVNSGPMMLVAAGGLLINLICAWLLHSDNKNDLNMQGAWLHLMGDALGSLGAILAGALIWRFGWQWADPLISVVIGLLVIVSAWRLVQDAVNVLLEGTPKHIDLTAVEAAMRRADGVQAVHDLHVWTIASGLEALSAHVIHEYEVKPLAILRQLRAMLQEEFGISHLTIQMETPDFDLEDGDSCHCGPEESRQKAAHAHG